jgi:hypothetical protein
MMADHKEYEPNFFEGKFFIGEFDEWCTHLCI